MKLTGNPWYVSALVISPLDNVNHFTFKNSCCTFNSISYGDFKPQIIKTNIKILLKMWVKFNFLKTAYSYENIPLRNFI